MTDQGRGCKSVTQSRDHRGRAGYSLVEISLALLVAGLGILAAFALFPQGLDSSRKSVEATEMSLFAQFVFESVQNDACSTNDWSSMLTTNVLNLTHALDGINESPPTQPVVRYTNTSPTRFYWLPSKWSTKGAALPTNTVATFTYKLDLDDVLGKDFVRYARLEVWPGDAGTSTPGTVFYREYRLAQ